MFVADADQAITRLGGCAAVKGMFKRVSYATVTNWRRRGFPPHAWLVISPQLKRRRILFNPYDLFNMLEPADGGHDG